MGLREQAAADLAFILEDDATGFAWPIKVTAPDGKFANLKGFSTDIHEVIDPETGVAVSGRSASVSIGMKALSQAGLDIPRGIADGQKTPWLIDFNDIMGKPHTFKVQSGRPDRTLGIVVCVLELYAR